MTGQTHAQSVPDETRLQTYWRSLPQDALAGLTGAVAGAPQAMGFAIVAGVSPLYGLYTAFVATIIGGLFSSSALITVGPTNALSLVVASALGMFATGNQLSAMFTLTVLTGVFLLLIGLLRLGNLTRFVSNAVMTGFITGAGLLIMLGQLNHLTGYEPETRHSVPLVRFWDWLLHLNQSLPTVTVVGLLAVVIIWGLHHTRFRSMATLIAIFLLTGLALIVGWDDVPVVRDMSTIPAGLPGLHMPSLELAPDLISTAFAIALLAAVQSAALIQATPNPAGKPNTSQDFTAMGVANIVGGVLQGMPACASLSRTAVNMSAGAKTRFANIYAGAAVGLILILFGSWIERIPLAVLAGHLIVAAASLIRFDSLRVVWRVGWTARAAMLATLLATLLLPLQYSIYIGVGLSLGLYAYTSANNIRLVRLVPLPDGRFQRGTMPDTLPENDVLILSVHGYMYFAAIQRLERLLPRPSSADQTALILRMREGRSLGSTGINMLHEYADALRARGGRLILSGVAPETYAQLERTGALARLGAENVFVENEIVFDSTTRAYHTATEWLKA